MHWNWQQPTWPNFTYDASAIAPLQTQLSVESGIIFGAVRHLNPQDKEHIIIEMLSNEAFKTSEIEGELLNRASIQSSIQKHFGLKASAKKIPPAEQGVTQVMLDCYQNFKTPLSHDLLFEWHRCLMSGRHDLKNVGEYRTDSEPMQIVSGYIHKPKVHFEAPPSQSVPKEMQAFIDWFNVSEKEDNTGFIRSGIAHLYFESIHPFEDGNGRLGRAISEKALNQFIGQPSLIALADTIEYRKKDYYRALEVASKSIEITPWLQWYGQTVQEAQKRTLKRVDFILQKGAFYTRLEDQLNERHQKVISRLFDAGIEGFKGGLSAENYIKITGVSRATATRDLANLVKVEALFKKGTLRHTRYYLNTPMSREENLPKEI